MKLPLLASIATIVLLLEYSSAKNLRQVEKTPKIEASRDLQVTGSCSADRNCEDPTLCCSQYGWCGLGEEYCDGTNPVPDTTPCGDGELGNNICEDPTLCCSQDGWCGVSTAHCGATQLPAPTAHPAPITPLPPSDSPVGGGSRLIAYIGNWGSCPTDIQLEQYTHIVIAFAVSYTYSVGKNACSATCEIATPPVCDSQSKPDLIQKWQDAGKKVILSFGGAGMGGSWPTSNNDCWEYCFGRESQVTDRLTEIVNEMGLDGVDIDYEYFYEDGQSSSNFGRGEKARKFLVDVTEGLREKLPEGAELTHAPMDSDVVPGTGYYNVLKSVANSLDYLMPQYYNGVVRPVQNFEGALQHYRFLKDDLFGGDANKIVFGFCITKCGEYDLDGLQSASVMKQLSENFECNGGAFFWMASHDVEGAWSIPVSNQIQIDSEQCSANEPVTPAPTSSLPTPAPTTSPSEAWRIPNGPPVASYSPTSISLTTLSPTVNPTAVRIRPTTLSPTVSPTAVRNPRPTRDPTVSPTTLSPTVSPTAVRTPSPTSDPTVSPTTLSPDNFFFPIASMDPTSTSSTTLSPSASSFLPTVPTTLSPTVSPTAVRTPRPTRDPTVSPTTLSPTVSPTAVRTPRPTRDTTVSPTSSPPTSNRPAIDEDDRFFPPVGPETCPNDIMLVTHTGVTAYPADTVSIISQDSTTVTVELTQTFMASESTIDNIYYQYQTNAFSNICYEKDDFYNEESVTFTIECTHISQIALLELWVADDITKGVLSEGDNAIIPDCCYPTVPEGTPVSKYLVEIKCVTECPEVSQ